MTNAHHAEMTHLIRREKELERKLEKLRDDFGTWTDRVELAQKTGRDELARRARQRVEQLRAEGRDLRRELKLLVAKKRMVRREHRRPTGNEVRRAEALLESFRQSGLVDPDEAALEEEFDQLRRGESAPPTDDAVPTSDEPSAEPTPEPPSSTPSDIDELTLEDLERLDADELERILDAEDD